MIRSRKRAMAAMFWPLARSENETTLVVCLTSPAEMEAALSGMMSRMIRICARPV